MPAHGKIAPARNGAVETGRRVVTGHRRPKYRPHQCGQDAGTRTQAVDNTIYDNRFAMNLNSLAETGQNLTMRMVRYNYVNQHKSLKGLSPAMAAGLSGTLLVDARIGQV